MSSARLIAFAVVLMSFGIYAFAAPTAEKRDNKAIVALLQVCLQVCTTACLSINISAILTVLVGLVVSLVTAVVAAINVCVTGLHGCSSGGMGTQASITVIAQLCVDIIAKISVTLSACVDAGVAISVFASIDVALCALVSALDGCFPGGGIIAIILKLCVQADIVACIKHCGFEQLAGLLGC